VSSPARRFSLDATLSLFALAGSLVLARPCEGGPLGSALREISKRAIRSSDEATQAVPKVLEHLARRGDEGLERLAKGLGQGKGGMTAGEAIGALRKLNIDDTAGDLAKYLDRLDHIGRRAVVDTAEQCRRVIELGVKGGRKVDDIVQSLGKGGPEGLLAVRTLENPEAVAHCLKGFDEYGEAFADFVKKTSSDEAVNTLGKHWDDLRKADPRLREDILRNPHKYFDVDGKPKPEFSKRLGLSKPEPKVPKPSHAPPALKKILLITGALLTFGLVGFEALRAVLGQVLGFLPDFLLRIANAVSSFVMWLLLLLILVPFGRPIFRALLVLAKKLMEGAARLPGLGAPAQRFLERLPAPRQRNEFQPASFPRGRRRELRLGLLGTKRVGKSTFIVMLTKHLGHLVPGASLTPAADQDMKEFAEIEAEVSECRPTKDDKRLELRLDWPFRRDGTSDERGKLAENLVLVDFPGEWAMPGASDDHRKRLREHLRELDALLIVFDPTDLEAYAYLSREGATYLSEQQKALQWMLNKDGLDLGERFQRALCVLLTKRDALSDELLHGMAAAASNKCDLPPDLVTRLCELKNKQEALTEEESRELGEGLLDLGIPGLRKSLVTRLEAVASASKRRRFFEWIWPKHRSEPQFAVFAVTQLGFELGREVVAHRKQVDEAKAAGATPPDKKTPPLDLNRPGKKELDLHHPFSWAFNHVPEGWLHQATSAGGILGTRCRRYAYRRFAGHPKVQADRRVFRTRGIARLVGILVAILAVASFGYYWEKSNHQARVRRLFELAASGRVATEQLRQEYEECRGLSTHPYQRELDAFNTILERHEELKSHEAYALAESREIPSRIESCRRWIRTAGLVPVADYSWPPELRTYRDHVLTPLPLILDRLTDLVSKRCEQYLSEKRLDDAFALLASCVETLEPLPRSPEKDKAAQQLESVRARAREASAENEYARIEAEVNRLVNEAKPPKWHDAIARLDNALTTPPPSAVRDRVATLRARTIEQFWTITDQEAKAAENGGDFPKMEEKLREFLRIPEPNPFRDQAAKSLELIPDKSVSRKVDEARGCLQQGKADEAWTLLDGVRAHVRRASEETRIRWHNAAVDACEKQGRWEEAVGLLNAAGDLGVPEDPVRLQDCWRRWRDHLVEAAPRLMDQNKRQEAERQVARFLNASGCPADLRREIQQFAEKRFTEARLREAIQEAAGVMSKEPAQAFERLKQAAVDVRANTDPKLLGEWSKALMDTADKFGRHAEIVKVFTRLSEDVFGSQSNEKGLLADAVEETWTRYVKFVQKEFGRQLAEGDRAEAWLRLSARLRMAELPDGKRKQLDEFKQQQIQTQWSSCQGEVRVLISDGKFEDARARLKQFRAELGSLVDDRLEKNLNAEEARIAEAEFARKIKEVEENPAGLDYAQRVAQIDRLLRGLGLSDEQKSRLTSLRDKLLTQWETDMRNRIREAHAWLNLATLHQLARDYTQEGCPYASQQPPDWRKAAENIKAWLEGFEQTKQYSLRAIGVSGLPEVPWYMSRYDPAFRVRIATADGVTDIEAQKDNCSGDFEITDFKTNTQFRWRKGVTIEIGMWDDYVEHNSHCMGIVTLTDPYALPLLVLRSQPVPVAQCDYKNDTAFQNLKVWLKVDGLQDFPALPNDLKSEKTGQETSGHGKSTRISGFAVGCTGRVRGMGVVEPACCPATVCR